MDTFLGMTAVFRSPEMQELMQLVERVARSGASVLIQGESGSGKELVARAIHHYSLRCSQSWVDVNCGALPENLVESELFGYEKGAFSSADHAKPGLFELAHAGTLFLDEIAELDPRMQVKLLRVLDGVPHLRLGGVKKISVDVRIIAATNRELDQLCKEGRFRSDLYYRLTQVSIRVPALRERPSDILPLAEFFLSQQAGDLRLADDAREVLTSHLWPGNVRELRNVITQAAVLADRSVICAADIPLAACPAEKQSFCGALGSLEQMERQMIYQALDRTGGHHAQAADILGISRRTLTRKLKRYGNLQTETAVA